MISFRCKPHAPWDTEVQRDLSLPQWKTLNLLTSGLWDERDWRAPCCGEFCCWSPSFCSYLVLSFNGFWEGETLAQITRADQGPSDWSIVFFHLSIKDEFLMEREGELCVWSPPRSSVKHRQDPWVTFSLSLSPSLTLLLFFFCPFLSFFASLLSVCWSLCHSHTHIQY